MTRKKQVRPLPNNTSWSTGDEDFDARIRMAMSIRDAQNTRLRAEVKRLRAERDDMKARAERAEVFVHWVRIRVETGAPVQSFVRGGQAAEALSAAVRVGKCDDCEKEAGIRICTGCWITQLAAERLRVAEAVREACMQALGKRWSRLKLAEDRALMVWARSQIDALDLSALLRKLL